MPLLPLFSVWYLAKRKNVVFVVFVVGLMGVYVGVRTVELWQRGLRRGPDRDHSDKTGNQIRQVAK